MDIMERNKSVTLNKVNYISEKYENSFSIYEKELIEIFEYFNEKAGKKSNYKTRTNYSKAIKRLKEGYTVDDFKKVIDNKIIQWSNTKFEVYIRTITLFGDKFDIYLQETKNIKDINNENEKVISISGYESFMSIMRSMKYEYYLDTDHWKHFRKECLIHFNNCCQVCGSVKLLVIHHKTYKNKGRETFNDVCCLCNDCHGKIHDR